MARKLPMIRTPGATWADFAPLLSVLLFVGCSSALSAQESAPQVVKTEHGTITAETLATGLGQISSLKFVSDTRLMIAQRSTGELKILETESGILTEIDGVPDVLTLEECESGEASCGIHDLALHPDFADNRWVYLSYSEGPHHYSTVAVDRFTLDGSRLVERRRIFTANAYAEDIYHFGGHLALKDGYLFISIGDRHHRERAQETSNHAGTIIRLHDDGRVPQDNPLVATEDALPEIWSYGHRNPYGLMFHPVSGELWSSDHGPAHGDELNRIVKGGNYGWPVVSFGWEYDGGPIGQGIRGQDGMQAPVKTWVRAIGPSDLAYYDGDLFPAWRGSFLIGSLSRVHLNRTRLVDNQVVVEERIMQGSAGRVRSIAVDSGGAVYFGSDSGTVVRLTPASPWPKRAR
jgi:glucose/arabinose dehydrogenase